MGLPQQHESLEGLLQQIETRAAAGDIPTERSRNDEGELFLVVSFGGGRRERLHISTPELAKELLQIAFERYRTVPGYEAIYDQASDEIEARLRPSGPFGPMIRNRRPFDEGHRMTAPASVGAQELEFTSASQEYVVIAAGLRLRPRAAEGAPVLRLKGFGATDNERAKRILDDIAPTILFELDIVYNVSVELAKIRDPRKPANRGWPTSHAPPEFPSNLYDNEPVALYMYARSARGMPLLEYLAYYQSVEFYFPRYSAEEVRRRVEGIVKDPRFNPHLERDVGRLVEVVQGGSGRTYGSELEQLKATFRNCVEAEEIREFLEEDEQRREFFRDRRSSLTPQAISLADRSIDLRDAAAARIYDLRCRIVHSKDEPDGELERLLPNSPEAHLLNHDLALLRLLAVRVIVASSRELVLSARADPARS